LGGADEFAARSRRVGRCTRGTGLERLADVLIDNGRAASDSLLDEATLQDLFAPLIS